MKAVRLHSYGDPDVLNFEDAPNPGVGPDDVLINVAAVGVNPLDWKIRSGALAQLMPLTLPFVLGWDVSGTVASVGAKVITFKPGDTVFGMIPIGTSGAYAEQATLPEFALASLPSGLKLVEAAAIPVVGLAAYQLVNGIGDLRPGQTTLVLGAAGNVGRLCVALAVQREAVVWAAATRGDLDRAGWQPTVRLLATDQGGLENASPGVDLLVDTVGGPLLDRCVALVRSGGRVVSTVQPPQIPSGTDIKAQMFQVAPDHMALKELGELFAKGRLPLPEITTFNLSEAARAHAAGEGGHSGKLVLICGE